MNRIARRHRRRNIEPGINLIPMLDILLFLIFFFIVATNVKTDTGELEITLPSSRSAAAATANDSSPVIAVDAQGRISYQGRLVVEEELRLELNALARGGARRIRIRSDGAINLQRWIDVVGFCNEAGLTEVVPEVARTGNRADLPGEGSK